MKKIGLSIVLLVLILLVSANTSFAAEGAADFSNAKYNFEYIGAGAAYLKIDGINISDEEIGHYDVAVTTENNEPTVDDNYNFVNLFKTENGGYKTGDVQSYLQLNSKEFYIWVYYIDYAKTGSEKYSLINGGAKVARLEDKLYSDVFSATFISNDHTQIIINVPWESKVQRNMQIKVGEINDVSILNKIKNSDVNGMKELLSYAKSASNSIYNQKVKSTADRNGYTEKLDLGYNNLKNASYYYLYVQLDDENGKYYPVEGVTLALSKKFDANNYWSLFFLGSSDFSWAGLANPEPKTDPDPTSTIDTSTANKGLPYTGSGTIIVLAIASVIACCVLFVKNEDYKGL